MLAALERLQVNMQGLEGRVDERHAELSQLLKVACERFGPAPTKPYVAKGGQARFKLHVAAVDGTDVLPAMWRTKCGVRFASWAFTRHASYESFPLDTLCTKCFGTRRAVSGPALQVALATSSSSECSASSD